MGWYGAIVEWRSGMIGLLDGLMLGCYVVVVM